MGKQNHENININKGTNRNATIELLRILSMIMVITLHGLDKGGQLTTMFQNDGGIVSFAENSGGKICAWILESFSIMAVDIYMLISGYFLVKGKFKTGRVIELICQVFFYSLGVLLLLDVTGLLSLSSLTRYEWFICLIPFHMNEYWFVTSYILMYLFSPVLAVAAKNMKQKQLGAVIIFLLLYESVFKSISPVLFDSEDKGYSVIWFITVFLIAAYFSLYGFGILKKWWLGLILYGVSVTLIFLENAYLQYRYSLAGSFELIQGISFHYNHIFVIAGAIGIFVFFASLPRIQGVAGKIICFISPLSFGVYLLHEQRMIRFMWPEWFGLNDVSLSGSQLIIKMVIAVTTVYIAGTVIDFIRKLIFDGVKKLIRITPLSKGLNKLDNTFNGL